MKFIGPQHGRVNFHAGICCTARSSVEVIVSARTNYSFVYYTCDVLNFSTRLIDRRMNSLNLELQYVTLVYIGVLHFLQFTCDSMSILNEYEKYVEVSVLRG